MGSWSVDATIFHVTSTRSTRRSSSATDPCGRRGKPVIVGGGVVLAARRGEGVRRAHRDGRAAGAGAVPGSDRRVAANLRVQRREHGGVRRVFDDTTPLVEGISIDEAFLEVGGLGAVVGDTDRDRGAAAARGARGRVGLAHHGRRRADEVPREGRERRREARRTARRAARPRASTFLHPLPVGRLWGVGPETTAKLNDRGITTVGEVARLAEPVLVAHAGPRRSGRHLHALARRPATRGPCWSGGGAARSGRSAAPGRKRDRSRRSSVARGPRRSASRARLRTAAAHVAARWCSACASTTSPASPVRTRRSACHRPRTPSRSSPTARGQLAGGGDAEDRAAGACTLVGVALAEPRRRPRSRCSPRLPFDTPRRPACSTPRSTTSATVSDRARSPCARMVGRDPGLTVPLLPD